MTPERLAQIKKHAEDAKCSTCNNRRTINLAAAQAFIYVDAPELFKHIEELERQLALVPGSFNTDPVSKTGM